ncbi:MAG TPA: sugar ABC transporter permease [Propionibacteriaceae bacterium]|jgi:alpha-1,4-digalacturonate transport system permease protein
MATFTTEQVARGPADAPAPRRRRSRSFAPLLFTITAMVLFALFFLWPGALGLVYSFTSYRGVGDLKFVGFENYTKLFADETFYTVLGRTALYTALAVPLHYVLALLIATLLVSKYTRGKTVARVVFFFPWLISPIVTGVIWRWLFGENFGFVNYALTVLGAEPVQWTTRANLSLGVVLFAGSWASTAFNMLLFIAALKNIPRSYLEAAEIDGASPWQRFRSVTLPLLAPTSFMVVLLSTISAMKEFAMVQALNGGGPGTQNMLMVQYIYQTGFERARIGYASAVSIVLMVILLIVAGIQMRFDRGGDRA